MAMAVVYTTFAGQIVSESRGGVVKEYLPDPLGSTIALATADAITDTWDYWPYGEVMTRTGSTPTPFTFVGVLGYFKDLLDKLFYVRARHYQPNYGRWLTVDPLWPRDYAYRYAGSCPAVFVDPSGKCLACGICIGVALLAGLIACANSPLGLVDCLKCWCTKNPAACSLLIAACAVACLACIPVIINSLRGLLGGGLVWAPVPAFAAGSGSQGDPCKDDDEGDSCDHWWSSCPPACEIAFYTEPEVLGTGWLACCHNYCNVNYQRCRTGGAPFSFNCCPDTGDDITPNPYPGYPS